MNNLSSKAKSLWSKWLLVVLWIAAILLALTISVFAASYDTAFFLKQYKSYNAAQTIGISEQSLEQVTHVLQDYLKGEVDSLDVLVQRNGVTQQFFNQREKDHMVDVIVLFDFARCVRNISLTVICVIIILLSTVFYEKDKPRPIIKSYLKVLAVTFTAVGAIVILAMINFNKLWNFAHTIVFTNELWLLDSATDMLINLVPLEFFIAISTRIGFMFGGLVLLPLVVYMLIRLFKKAGKKESVA